MTYEQHDIGKTWPPLQTEEISKLGETITNNPGQKPPVILFEGKVLDGWHYYTICRNLGIEVVFEELPIGVDPIEFVIRRHDGRRHLTTGQRAMVADRMAVLKHGSNRFQEKVDARIRASTSESTKQEMAKLLRVGTTSLDEVRYAKERGIPEIYKALEDGKLKPYIAKEISRLPKEQQGSSLAAVLDNKSRKTSGLPVRKSKRVAAKKQFAPWPTMKFPTPEETGFPVNGTLEQKFEHSKKYGRTPMHPKEVKDMLNKQASLTAYVAAISLVASDTHPDAEAFSQALDEMLAWVPRPEKGQDYGINFASKAKKNLALVEEKLPVAIDRLTKLSAAIKTRSNILGQAQVISSTA